MSKIVLYGATGSCSMVANALLSELGIPFEDFRLKMGANGIEAVDGSMDRAAYLKIHPSGYVPALSVDGEVITENPAIFRYISGLRPERQILGNTLLEQVRVEEWLVWLSGTVHGYGIAGLWAPKRFVPAHEGAMIEAVKIKGRETLLKSFDKIEEKIVGPFAIGSEWTAPDVFLHTFWRWGHKLDLEDMAGRYPRWNEQIKAIEKLPGLRKAMAIDEFPLYFP